MRISDWSSDVCSSDLLDAFWDSGLGGQLSATVNLNGSFAAPRGTARLTATDLRPRDSEDMPALQLDASAQWQEGRSEEHTSELQSLMRISYAVFCLKKKNK